MKYLYKQTGVTVESGVELDPAVFKPVTEPEEETVSQEPAEQEETENQEAVEREKLEIQEPVKEEKPVKTAAKKNSSADKEIRWEHGVRNI